MKENKEDQARSMVHDQDKDRQDQEKMASCGRREGREGRGRRRGGGRERESEEGKKEDDKEKRQWDEEGDGG
eukprot:767851-Hanusia_phi.AAC.1